MGLISNISGVESASNISGVDILDRYVYIYGINRYIGVGDSIEWGFPRVRGVGEDSQGLMGCVRIPSSPNELSICFRYR